MIVAGDIGGTNIRLACVARRGDALTIQSQATFPSRDFPSLNQAVERFLAAQPGKFESACFGIAGPVIGGRCQTTNLPWVVEASKLSESIGTPHVALLNDLEAAAYSVNELEADDMVELQAGADGATGNRAVIAAGTGLGEAGIFWNGRSYQPFASEGGHADFAARDELEIELLRYLIGRFGHASWERVVSGPGLVNVYQFLCERSPAGFSQAVAVEVRQGDPAAVIARAAQRQTCLACVQALSLFVSLYGAEAGNLALKLMARGGLYIAGGIAPKIIDQLRQPEFLASILSKGRFQSLLKSIPIRIIVNDRAALLGAAHYADLMLQNS